MSKPVILTGLRANNDLHLGNYLGALLPLVDMANARADEYQINLFVPDLHSFTTPIDHSKLQQQIFDTLRSFVAAGLNIDHENVFIYRQSYIPAHSELAWILSCFTYFGEMRRMTQFKEKGQKYTEAIKDALYNSGVGRIGNAKNRKEADKLDLEYIVGENVSVGLFNYPALMAADILLYKAEYVPVGDDQTQHLEFTRDIAERLNNKFGRELFVVPKPVKQQHGFFGKDQGLRIRDLQNPEKKMSKSEASGKGVIFLTDSPEAARKKIMAAETDSLGKVAYDYNNQPGVSNLLDILELLGGIKDKFIGQDQYGPLKEAVADKVNAFLSDFQKKLAAVDDAKVNQKLEASEYLMREVSGQTLSKVQQAIGLRPKNS
jgi:tryptophanyl-tRNA synthetase